MFNFYYFLYCFKMNICFHEENIKTNKVLLINSACVLRKIYISKSASNTILLYDLLSWYHFDYSQQNSLYVAWATLRHLKIKVGFLSRSRRIYNKQLFRVLFPLNSCIAEWLGRSLHIIHGVAGSNTDKV